MLPPETAAPRFAMSNVEFIGLMAGLQALQALAIDVMLPALGVISRDLALTNPNDRQLIIGVFLICSGIGSLFPGSLADRFGRKPVVLVCLVAYFAISLVSALITDFTALLVLRGLLGLLTSGLMVLPMAIIRDRFSGDQMARMQSLVGVVFMVVPMIAPFMGQGVLLVADWRWIFGIMAGLAMCMAIWTWIRLPETMHPEFRQPIALGVILGNMGDALRNRDAAGYFIGGALVAGVMFGYINSAQQLVAEHFGAGEMFPVVFAGMALFLACTNFVNSTIVQKFGARRVSHTALFAYIAVATVHLIFAMRGETLWTFIPFMTASFCLMAFITANFQSISLQPFARTAGSAASVMAFVRLLLGASLGSLIGHAYDNTPRPLIGSMVVAGIGALLLVLYSERGRLFRRINYPLPVSFKD